MKAETPAGGAFTDRARAFLALHPETAEAGRVRLKAIAETGYSDWYPWAVDNWGTKWGAYQFEEVAGTPERYEFTFQTAWSFPLPIFEKLTERFPLLDFQCATFDEGWNFAAFGHFAEGTLYPFKSVTPDDVIYARVYGHAPEKDEDDEEAE